MLLSRHPDPRCLGRSLAAAGAGDAVVVMVARRKGLLVFEIDWSGPAGLVVVIAVVVAITGLVGVFLFVKLIKKHRQVNQPDTPFSAKFVYYASLVYAIFPIDLLPDPALVDDIGVLLGALLYVSRVVKKLGDRNPKRSLAEVSRGGQPGGGQAVPGGGQATGGGQAVPGGGQAVSRGREASGGGRGVPGAGQAVPDGGQAE
jgi:uncharacterized membrane protein YkvA (DUF1232 family)